MIKTPPQITEVTFWKLTCSWHSWQQKSCQRHQAKQEQYLPRYVLLVAQPGGVGVLCPDTVHGVLCLRGRPAVHLERSGYPLKGVSLNPSLGQTTITHLKRKNPFYSKRIFAVLSLCPYSGAQCKPKRRRRPLVIWLLSAGAGARL